MISKLPERDSLHQDGNVTVLRAGQQISFSSAGNRSVFGLRRSFSRHLLIISSILGGISGFSRIGGTGIRSRIVKWSHTACQRIGWVCDVTLARRIGSTSWLARLPSKLILASDPVPMFSDLQDESGTGLIRGKNPPGLKATSRVGAQSAAFGI